jgi:hypothetical protein
VTFLSDREAELSSASNAGQVARAWQLWTQEQTR